MSTLLFMPGLGREIAESNRRAADSLKAEAASWLQQEQDPAVLRRRGLRAVREVTHFTLSRKSDARAVWQSALEILEEGITAEESRQILQITRDVCDTWLGLAQKTRALWEDVTAVGVVPE